MNYLGHAILSGTNDQFLVGNMIGDFVKGKNFEQYPISIQKGIRFHRLIDSYTDSNTNVLEAKKILRESEIKHAGIFIDIIFDHFIAQDEAFFKSEDELKNYTENVFEKLQAHFDFLTEDMIKYFNAMIDYNWLFHYRFRSGIEKAIQGFLKRYPHLGEADEVVFALFNNYSAIHLCYEEFMPKALIWASNERAKLIV